MDVKKNFIQAFKELTGTEEEAKENVAEVKTTEDKPAFSAAFDSIKAKYSDGTAPETNSKPTTETTNQNNNQTAKPSFSPANNTKPSFSPINNQSKTTDVKPSFTPMANTNQKADSVNFSSTALNQAATMAKNDKTEIETKEEKPVETKKSNVADEMPTETNDFINTFLKSRNDETAETSEPLKATEKPVAKDNKVFETKSPISATTSDTVISAGTDIVGSIEAIGNIIIGGNVKGDITTSGDITINGRVEGILTCKTAVLNDCDLIGDINSTDSVKISSETKIDGNIETETIRIDGKVKGNIKATTSVHIMRNALVIGDIVTSKISIDEGAMIQGNISMKMN